MESSAGTLAPTGGPSGLIARIEARIAAGTRWSLAIAILGAAALAIVIVGSLAVLVARGVTPVSSLIAGLESSAMQLVLIAGLVAGAVAFLGGALYFRLAPTLSARDDTVAGLVLGLQAALVGALGLWWTSGDVTLFAESFLDFDRVTPELDAFLTGALNTIKLAFTAEAVGLVLGLAAALLAISRYAVVRAPARVFINTVRATPLLWQISFVYFGLALGLRIEMSAYTAAIIALSINASAYLAEVFRAGIQSIERGQLDAARGLGLSRFQAMRAVILPQAVLRVIPPLMNDFVILIKDTSLVLFLGLTVGERELMSVGQEGYADTFNATFFVFTALGYLAICLPLIAAVNRVEKRLRSGLVGVAGA
jgi:His/Glu/Gln/Arg/opine family amino acid ABC transporter permease subunit